MRVADLTHPQEPDLYGHSVFAPVAILTVPDTGGARVRADRHSGVEPGTARWTGDAPGLEGAGRAPDTSDPLCQIRPGYLTPAGKLADRTHSR
ncbi:hypothetical protein GCM10022225_03810 [Plantactinospora mayteni]|uniref:Uncharacterized protein n=1 Tax=Plantactinospora mayteni TaxID=566021 RepID=A0ABQ4EQH3_9ACTN|nr:hypothetical protein Pma05_34430 [Plantactinospora mayteni]